MPLAVIVFALPSEQEEYAEILKSPGYRAALGDVWNKVRSKLKYEEIPAEEVQPYENVREWLVNACQEWDIEIP